MKVVEIFKSIDGEGKRTGQPATFVRLAGCNLRCSYCDTKYSFDISQATEMRIDEIINKCVEFGYHNVTLTGGEPLMYKDSEFLIYALCRKGFRVNIETNGSIDLYDLIWERTIQGLNFFFTVDYKTKYSGMNALMNKAAFEYLEPDKDIVKCVVANKEDMDDVLQYLDSFEVKKFNIWFSPVFGAIEPKEIVDYVMNTNREDITVQVQLHKIIWDPEMRGV